ncbi:MAG: 4'-phosphopantetheinyl transferase superfamily protein [Candidatus Aenigmarchaeota archaeon]|nr:4'-phosphopantetheinyl transferase superfamily protein [Candidatus Aenigmarchaeota archaeon]
MKVRIGNDIVDVKRFGKSIKSPKFVEHVFLKSELNNMDVDHLAGIFAAKEAVMKALDMKPGSWLNIEITKEKSGRPKAKFVDVVVDSDLSITHDGRYAMATFVVVKDG